MAMQRNPKTEGAATQILLDCDGEPAVRWWKTGADAVDDFTGLIEIGNMLRGLFGTLARRRNDGSTRGGDREADHRMGLCERMCAF